MRRALLAGAVAVLMAAFFAVHARQGLERPVPWIDEGYLLWQAHAFHRDGSLVAPQLRREGPLLWMPPGYMIVAGLAFAVTGFSLEAARHLSAVFLAGAIAALAAALVRLRHPFAMLLLLAAFALSPIAQLVGNLGRMEALLLLVAALALLAFQRRALLGAVALGALGPLVHPMGALLELGLVAGAAVVAVREPRRRSARAWEMVLAGAALLAWAGYLGYVLRHLDAFRAEMALQFESKGRKAGAGLESLRRLTILPWVMLTGSGAVAAAALRLRLPSAVLVVYALPLAAASVLLRGFPYDVYPALLALLVAVVTLEVGSVGWERLRGAPPRRASALALGAALAFVLTAGYRHAQMFLRDVGQSMVPRSSAPSAPYVEPEDWAAVAEALRAVARARPVTVAFYPEGDGLLFASLQDERLRIVQQTHRSLGPADVVVVHESGHLPRHLDSQARFMIFRLQGITSPLEAWPVVRERDGSERWRIFERRGDGAPTPPGGG